VQCAHIQPASARPKGRSNPEFPLVVLDDSWSTEMGGAGRSIHADPMTVGCMNIARL